MKITTRRELLKGLACGSLIVGFDPKLDHLPHLDGVLRTDDEALLPGA